MKMKLNSYLCFPKSTLVFLLSTAFLSCANNAAETHKIQSDSTTAQIVNQQSQDANSEQAKVAFKVNGVQANTQKGKGNDDEAQLGMFNMINKSLSFDLLGDEPNRPHRGWLHFTVNNFSLQTASYTLAGDNSASFTRYETENAGGGVDYNASNYPNASGSQLSIQFTEIVKNEDASIGEEYLATGTFSLKLILSETAKNDLKSIDISEGRFEKVPIRILGKKS